jgi:ribonuclease HI
MRKRNFRKQSQLGFFPTTRPALGSKCAPGEVTAHGLTVFCDGGCEPNPGVGGWAFVAYRDGQEIAHDFSGIEIATNNVAELTALLRAAEWVSENVPGELATIISDSRYVVDGCNAWRHSWKAKGWKRKGADAKPANQAIANLDLWQVIDAELTSNPLISVVWCKGHAGIVGNVRADELASIGRASLDTQEANLGVALDRGIQRHYGRPVMDLAPFNENLPADRIEVYGFHEPGGWQFLTVYSLGEIDSFGTYSGQSYDDAMREAHRLEQTMRLPSFDWVGHSFTPEAA